MTTATETKNVQFLFGQDEFVSAWVRERVADAGEFKDFSTIGLVLGDRLIAGFVYHDYIPRFETIVMTMAADSPVWARPETIRALLSYPFEQLGCFKIRVVIALDNERSLKNNRHIGFKQEGVLVHEFGKGRHAVVMRMLKPTFENLYYRQGSHE
jgi:RimJ/RimL family protein N-acetyltransferase